MRSIQFVLLTVSLVIFSLPSHSQEYNQSGFYYEYEDCLPPSERYLSDKTYGSLHTNSPAAFDWGGTNPPPAQPSVPLEDGAIILIVALLLYRAIKVYTNNPIKDTI